MSFLFREDINDWQSWSKVFQSIKAWQPLIEYIFQKENLPCGKIENLTPGTNAVFKVGNTVAKIIAPKESGMDAHSDYETELFGLKRANTLNIPAPELLANGCINDKYEFLYLITGFIEGDELVKIDNTLTDAEKEEIGYHLRIITDKLNTPCARFNKVDVINRAVTAKQWRKFPDSFICERLDWLNRFQNDEMVFVHGDFNPDNILVDTKRNLYVIDFADSVTAPAEYELAAIVCEAFCFEEPYMNGFFGKNYCVKDISEKCFRAVLMHDFGENIIENNFGKTQDIVSLSVLKERIYDAVKGVRQYES